jgi:UDP-N-acetylmuramoylalanine--D-glutamate ligase
LDVKNQRILVVGLGKSGVAAALFLQDRGARVTVSDARAQAQLGEAIPKLLDRGVVVETGGHGERTFRDQDMIVVSPGVPADLPHLVQAQKMGLPIIGEVELAFRYLKGQTVAITGSNGKTTTTTLVGEVLKHSGKPTLVGGNIGTPVIELVDQSRDDGWNVLEVSSFQLETIHSFRPKVAAILNITPDHLDRHHTLEAYTAAKARIFEKQDANDFAILNADDPICVGLTKALKSRVVWFSRKQEVERGAFCRGDQIVYRDSAGETVVMPVAEIPLKGSHNIENVLAAVTAATLCGCEASKIREAVKAFRAVEHRLEFVAKLQGVEYYNDSKATNVDATMKALESFPANIHLILGGKDKGSDYSVMRDLLQARARRVYTIGAAAEKIAAQISGAVPIEHAQTLENAIHRASELAQSGDIVLLAPACASFDQFESYEHRGRIFKQTVLALQDRMTATAAGERRG